MTGIEHIQSVVAAHFGVSLAALLGITRGPAHVARARHVAMAIASELTGLSQPALARAFRRLDHTTIGHGIARVSTLRARDAVLDREYAALVCAIREGPCWIR